MKRLSPISPEEKHKLIIKAALINNSSIKTSVAEMLMSDYLFKLSEIYSGFIDEDSAEIICNALSSLDPKDLGASADTLSRLIEAYEKTAEDESDYILDKQFHAHILALKIYIGDMIMLYCRNISNDKSEKISSILKDRSFDHNPDHLNTLYNIRDDVMQLMEL